MDITNCLKEIEEQVGRLSPLQKILLGTDGSVTQLLESVTGHPVSVRTCKQEIIKADGNDADRLNIHPGDEVNNRIVELFDSVTGNVLIYAKSQTPLSRLAPEFRDDLMRADIPIGKIINRHHIEARREIVTARLTSDDTNGIFPICKNELLLMRQYRIIHGGEPLIFIEEEFPYNQFLDERKIIVNAPSRLHMTLLDMNGGLGRVDGGVGITLDDPSILLEVKANPTFEISGCDKKTATIIEEYTRNILTSLNIKGNVSITVREYYPSHCGLGSGSQLALATARACSELYGKTITTPELARISGRGGTSGIGTAAFDNGGFIVDGGHRFGPDRDKSDFTPSSASKGVPPPPVLARFEVPKDWSFVVAIPEISRGASGSQEREIFKTFCPIPIEEVRQLCHEILIRMLPGIAEKDLDQFGASIDAIQNIGFKKIEHSFQPKEIATLLDIMRSSGAAGAGMSSFGPTLYAVNDTGIHDIQKASQSYLDEIGGGKTFVTMARNFGANIRIA